MVVMATMRQLMCAGDSATAALSISSSCARQSAAHATRKGAFKSAPCAHTTKNSHCGGFSGCTASASPRGGLKYMPPPRCMRKSAVKTPENTGRAQRRGGNARCGPGGGVREAAISAAVGVGCRHNHTQKHRRCIAHRLAASEHRCDVWISRNRRPLHGQVQRRFPLAVHNRRCFHRPPPARAAQCALGSDATSATLCAAVPMAAE